MAKVLIIDDVDALRKTICELLSFAGYKVFEAQNGKEALEKVKDFKPDIIICDIMMPELDGYGFMEQHIKSENSYIPVIFLTAKVGSKDKERGVSLGVKHYLKKPFVFDELKVLIELYLVEHNK